MEDRESPPSPSLPPTRSPSPELDGFYNMQSVAFQAERRVFEVLKQGFMAPGTKFESILADPNTPKGKNVKNPILLDVSAKDFRAFLRVLYPFWNFGSYEEADMDISDWTGVLRLAKEWNFTRIREKAVTELTRLLNGKFRDMIRLGQELSVEDWLRQGLVGLAGEICKNELKPTDVVVVGERPIFVGNEWAHVANMFYLCQKVFKNHTQGYVVCCGNYVGPNYSTYTCGNCGKFWQHDSLTQLVNDVFSVELATARNDPPLAANEPSGTNGPAASSADPTEPSGSSKKKKKGKGKVV
jgi:hypothetical protein